MVTRFVHEYVHVLTNVVSGRSKEEKVQNAISVYASLVGGLILARAVDDPAYSDVILEAVKKSVKRT